MYQKDYILRMIEMLGEILRAIFSKIQTGKFHEAEETLNEIYLTFLRKDAAFFQQIPSEDLTKTLIAEHNFTNGHLEVLAELLYAEAELLVAKNKEAESLPYYQKSLLLFEYIDESYRTFSEDRLNKMKTIREKILPD